MSYPHPPSSPWPLSTTLLSLPSLSMLPTATVTHVMPLTLLFNLLILIDPQCLHPLGDTNAASRSITHHYISSVSIGNSPHLEETPRWSRGWRGLNTEKQNSDEGSLFPLISSSFSFHILFSMMKVAWGHKKSLEKTFRGISGELLEILDIQEDLKVTFSESDLIHSSDHFNSTPSDVYSCSPGLLWS